MVNERFRFILFIIFSITIFWFTIILLCLPQSDELDQWQMQQQGARGQVDGYDTAPSRPEERRRVKPPRPPNFMRYFQSRPTRKLTHLETLFYEFDPTLSPESATILNGTIATSQHEAGTLSLSSINNPIDQLVKDKGDKLFAFNLLVSNRVGLSRPLPDTRPDKCLRTVGIARESQQIASIIICYYNEAPSALLRTIYSIMDRTPKNLIKEIIVVDDFSEPGYDMNHVQSYLESLPHHELIRFSRTPKREGLIRARLFGANQAKGRIIVFLDSHVEANVGWLEPLLQLVQANKTTIACPMIDKINAETMIYSASPMVRGGLTWALHFKWDSVPAEDLKTYDDFAKPIKSASMAGGLYAIDRDFFNYLGAYDPGMNLWGGENIELSLRAWMCGGQILIVPCSRLGHIFRKTRPYGPKVGEPDSLLYNSHRSARVWLDEEHLDRFYELSPDARSLDSGDISERLEIRRQLNCKNFTWFLDNIYPTLKSELAEAKGVSDGVKNDDQRLKHQRRNLFVANSKRINRSVDRHRFYWPRHRKTRHHVSLAVVNADESALSDDTMTKFDPMSRWARDYESDHENTVASDDNRYLRLANKPPQFLSKFYPPRRSPKIISTFQIQLINSNLCIESKTSFMAQEISRLVLNNCLPMTIVQNKSQNLVSDISGNNSSSSSSPLPPPHVAEPSSLAHDQIWSETELHDYRLGTDRCLDIMKNLPLLRKCNNMSSFQAWTHLNHTLGTYISHYSSGELCLAVERVQRGEPIIVTICDRGRNDDDILNPSALLRVDILSRPRRFPSQRLERHLASAGKMYPIRDAAGGSWLTGPLPRLEPVEHGNQHKHQSQQSMMVSSSSELPGLNQKWKLIPV